MNEATRSLIALEKAYEDSKYPACTEISYTWNKTDGYVFIMR